MLRPRKPRLPPWRPRVSQKHTAPARNAFASDAAHANEQLNPTTVERPQKGVDVCIVGESSSGMSDATRLKQLEREIRVVTVENGAEIAPHILSGGALDEPLPYWKCMPDKLPRQSSSSLSPLLRPRKPRHISLQPPTFQYNPFQNAPAPTATRTFATSARRANEPFNPTAVERAEDEVDVCIVGGGPAGLSAGIRLKQLEREKGRDIRVVVLEKGAEIGSHIVSGGVVEPRALDELLPDWKSMPDHPLTQPSPEIGTHAVDGDSSSRLFPAPSSHIVYSASPEPRALEMLPDLQSIPKQLRRQPSFSLSPTLRPRKPHLVSLRVPTLEHAPRQKIPAHASTTRTFATSATRANEPFNPTTVERAEDEVDVCIVGGGPAGLSAAIRLKQLEREKGREIRVVVLEKGAEIGSHIVSGAVIEPRALDELLPDWKSMPDHPLTQPALSSRMLFLTQKHALPIPHPPQMGNNGNYIVSLSAFTRWLASVAENEYGVEIYAGFAGAQLLLSDAPDSVDAWGRTVRSVRGVFTNEVGLTRDYRTKSAFEPGMAFRAKVTLLAEGAHGSLSKQAIGMYDLRKEAEPQTYALGVKEVWRVPEARHRPGEVVHTMGWPLGTHTYGGGWVYHMDGGLVSLGLVVGLDYENPYLSPYREFQRMKHHPYFRSLLVPTDGGPPAERIAYAARVLTEGGLQSVPKLHFPGGALMGCSAGFVNVAKIKGTHNAMKSGMLAAEGAVQALQALGGEEGAAADLAPYDKALHASWVRDDLHEVRNLRPSFGTALGIWGGIAYSGIDSLLLKGRVPWTFSHGNGKYANASTASIDADHTAFAADCKPIEYPPFEPPLSTDLLTSVALTGTNHAEDQPVHLRVVPTRKYVEGLYSQPQNEGASTHLDPAVGAGAKAVQTVAEAMAAESGLSEEAAKARVEEELRTRREHVERNVGMYAGLLGRACPAAVYEYVRDEDAAAAVEGKEGAAEEGESWRGHRLVINSQNCIHCKLCDVKVPTQDITWTVPEGSGGPKYTVT